MLKKHPGCYNRRHMHEMDSQLTPFARIVRQREDAIFRLQAGEREAFGTYLKDLTLELNSEMRLLTGPAGGVVESAWLINCCTANLAAMWIVDTKTALENGVKPVWLDLAAVNFMRMEGYDGFQILWDGYFNLKKSANEWGIRGYHTYRKDGRDCYEPE
jgi:hypothetical protein